MTYESCETCEHYRPSPLHEHPHGHCHRYPPLEDWKWPQVYESNFCGEYEEKEVYGYD